MTLLLDTQVFLWWLDDPRRLSKLARDAIGDASNSVDAVRRLSGRFPSSVRLASSTPPMMWKQLCEQIALSPFPSPYRTPWLWQRFPITTAIRSIESWSVRPLLKGSTWSAATPWSCATACLSLWLDSGQEKTWGPLTITIPGQVRRGSIHKAPSLDGGGEPRRVESSGRRGCGLQRGSASFLDHRSLAR